MTTFDIGNNLKQIICFGVCAVVCGALAIKGLSTNDIVSIGAALVGVMTTVGLAVSDPIRIGKNEDGNDKTE